DRPRAGRGQEDREALAAPRGLARAAPATPAAARAVSRLHHAARPGGRLECRRPAPRARDARLRRRLPPGAAACEAAARRAPVGDRRDYPVRDRPRRAGAGRRRAAAGVDRGGAGDRAPVRLHARLLAPLLRVGLSARAAPRAPRRPRAGLAPLRWRAPRVPLRQSADAGPRSDGGRRRLAPGLRGLRALLRLHAACLPAVSAADQREGRERSEVRQAQRPGRAALRVVGRGQRLARDVVLHRGRHPGPRDDARAAARPLRGGGADAPRPAPRVLLRARADAHRAARRLGGDRRQPLLRAGPLCGPDRERPGDRDPLRDLRRRGVGRAACEGRAPRGGDGPGALRRSAPPGCAGDAAGSAAVGPHLSPARRSPGPRSRRLRGGGRGRRCGMSTPQLQRLHGYCHRLRLYRVEAELTTLLEQAAKRDLGYTNFLDELLALEVRAKAEKHLAMRTAMARFPFHKTLESFDFKFQPSIDPKVIRELAAGRYIENAENALLLGPPGVGKTHLAVALGLAACAQGVRTLFTTATGLIATLGKAFGENRLDERLKLLTQPQVLIIDEIGYIPIDRHGANLFFQL